MRTSVNLAFKGLLVRPHISSAFALLVTLSAGTRWFISRLRRKIKWLKLWCYSQEWDMCPPYLVLKIPIAVFVKFIYQSKRSFCLFRENWNQEARIYFFTFSCCPAISRTIPSKSKSAFSSSQGRRGFSVEFICITYLCVPLTCTFNLCYCDQTNKVVLNHTFTIHHSNCE